jgi:hypothetical protein
VLSITLLESVALTPSLAAFLSFHCRLALLFCLKKCKEGLKCSQMSISAHSTHDLAHL